MRKKQKKAFLIKENYQTLAKVGKGNVVGSDVTTFANEAETS